MRREKQTCTVFADLERARTTFVLRPRQNLIERVDNAFFGVPGFKPSVRISCCHRAGSEHGGDAITLPSSGAGTAMQLMVFDGVRVMALGAVLARSRRRIPTRVAPVARVGVERASTVGNSGQGTSPGSRKRLQAITLKDWLREAIGAGRGCRLPVSSVDEVLPCVTYSSINPRCCYGNAAALPFARLRLTLKFGREGASVSCAAPCVRKRS